MKSTVPQSSSTGKKVQSKYSYSGLPSPYRNRRATVAGAATSTFPPPLSQKKRGPEVNKGDPRTSPYARSTKFVWTRAAPNAVTSEYGRTSNLLNKKIILFPNSVRCRLSFIPRVSGDTKLRTPGLKTGTPGRTEPPTQGG